MWGWHGVDMGQLWGWHGVDISVLSVTKVFSVTISAVRMSAHASGLLIPVCSSQVCMFLGQTTHCGIAVTGLTISFPFPFSFP